MIAIPSLIILAGFGLEEVKIKINNLKRHYGDSRK